MKTILLICLTVAVVGAFWSPFQGRVQLTHRIGSRIRGDYFVYNISSPYQSYWRATNVRVRYSYPLWGMGKNVSMVEVVVGQSSVNGTAYVTRGGIGQRFIEVTVEARNTTYYSAIVRFYGK